jgi:hypothetical protein
MLRRLGNFDDANAHFEKIKQQEEFKKSPFTEIIAREQKLIAAKDASAQ